MSNSVAKATFRQTPEGPAHCVGHRENNNLLKVTRPWAPLRTSTPGLAGRTCDTVANSSSTPFLLPLGGPWRGFASTKRRGDRAFKIEQFLPILVEQSRSGALRGFRMLVSPRILLVAEGSTGSGPGSVLRHQQT